MWTLKRELVRDGEAVYMTRYHLLVLGKWLRIYLNAIHTPDGDIRLHSHPYRRSWSLKLLGRYVEVVPPFRCQRPARLSRIPEWHRIVWLSRPTVWTLFIGWRRDLPWGFLNPDGSVEYRP